jgi:hypothetical protein
VSGNGQLTPDELTTVQGSIRLSKSTAAAWGALVNACAKATGVVLTITSPYGGYRDLAQQRAIKSDPTVTAPTASPGGSSHGYGKAVDIYNWKSADEWLTANASKYGFKRTIPGEKWHFENTGGTMSDPFTFDPFGTGALSENANRVLQTLSRPTYWARVAIFALGIVLLLIALITLVRATPVAKQTEAVGKKVAATVITKNPAAATAV